MRAKHSADNPVTRSPVGPPHSPTEHTVGGGRDDGYPRDPWSCCACAAPGAPACRAGVRCNSVRKTMCPRQSMLRELLYPRAMAGPSLPGHPPQTPNNARCPPQPPSAYILVRGASLCGLPVCVAYSSSSGFCRRHAQHRTNFGACFNVFPPEIAADPALQRPVLEARLRGRCERKRRGGWQTALQTASRNRTAVRRRILSFLLIRPATMRTCPPLPSVELVAPRWAA